MIQTSAFWSLFRQAQHEAGGFPRWAFARRAEI
jgi:hypothetical protein